MNVPYIVELSAAEREQLQAMVSAGSCAVRKLKRAQVLLAAERGAGDAQVASMVGVGTSTVYRTKRRLVEEGLEAALSELPRPGAARKLTGQEDALLVAIACSAPPQGRARWTLELLADALVQCTEHSTLSRETVRRRLHEQQLKPWQKRMWCIQAIDAEYVARMEDVLELYTTPPEPGSAVVCFDETPVQLIGEARVPVPAQAGQPARIDYEYRRNGTANLFVFLDAHRPWRHVKVTERRTAHDFAQCMHDLLTVHYPDAQQVKVVLDLVEHGRDRNRGPRPPVPGPPHPRPRVALCREIGAWQHQRNEAACRVKWLFGIEQARAKLGRHYPSPQSEPLQQAA